jgi:sugar O-acyltransferase (sialic acid O-acetyltransferase NeuD family)
MSDDIYDICLFGAGGHGRVVAAQLQSLHNQNVCFADSGGSVGTSIGDIPVRFSSLSEIRDIALIVTIGDNETRAKLQKSAKAHGCKLACFIADPDKYFAEPPGEGSMVLAGAIVTKDARIGKGVIVNSGAIVEHDSVIGDYCHLAPGSVVAGNSRIEPGVLLGANATVVNGAFIAAGTVIGAGAVVTRDIREKGVYVGNPARKVGV